MAVPGWALLDFCSILGEIGKASHVPAIGQRASIRHVQLLFQLSSYDQFEEDIHQRINQGCEIVSISKKSSMLPPILQALTSVIKSPTYNSWQLAREVINGITGLNSQVKSYASQKDIKLTIFFAQNKNFQKFAIHAKSIHPLICRLLESDCPLEIRQILSKYFLRTGTLAGFNPE